MICEHLDWDNERDCKEKAEYLCMCCSSPVCPEHNEKICPYGGAGYIEIDDSKEKKLSVSSKKEE